MNTSIEYLLLPNGSGGGGGGGGGGGRSLVDFEGKFITQRPM